MDSDGVTIFGFKLNWQFILLICLVLSYSVFCSYDFINDISEQDKLDAYERSHPSISSSVEFQSYTKLAKDSFSMILIEWLSGLGASVFALILIFKGQKATIKEAEQHVKIELLSKHISKLNDNKVSADNFYAQIETQFSEWNLSKSESEIAILLLKGLSFKEMAEVRGSNEKTIRQQASSIYGKSGQKGRSEFSAFFFEEILMLNMNKKLGEA